MRFCVHPAMCTVTMGKKRRSNWSIRFLSTQTQDQVTQILKQLDCGHASAAERLLPLVYEEMRGLAESFFRLQPSDHTLQPTALVHEAYLRLVNQTQIQWTGRAHFYAVAARAMRQILINHAEKRRALKRGGEWRRITLDESSTSSGATAVDLLALNEALEELERLDERQCRVIELRFFGGLSVDEAASVLGLSSRSVELDWQMARAWLYNQLKD